MRKIYYISIFIIVVTPVFGSSGDGMSFFINNFNLKITWSWQENTPLLYGSDGVDVILMMRTNYEVLYKRNEDIWVDYWVNDETNKIKITFSKIKDNSWEIYAREEITLDGNFYKNFRELIKKKLKLKEKDINECELYGAFIPSSYIEPDSKYQKEIMWFLRQSELYLAHEMALQSNVQGYVYSIFFNKHVMYNYLKKLNVKKVIVNKKTLNYDSVYSLNIALF